MDDKFDDPLRGLALRQPPSNKQAEAALLGAIMANAKACHVVVEFLRPDHFAEPAHGRIFGEQARRILAGGVADAIAMKNWWDTDPDAPALGGFSYLAHLTAAMVSPLLAKEYATAIRDSWVRRELIEAGADVVDAGFDQGSSPEEAVASAIAQLDRVLQPNNATRLKSLDSAMDDAIAAADAAAKRNGPAGVSTGFPSIDAALGGLEPSTLIVLAGRPGMGKSALGWQVAINVARTGIGVLVISLEMSATELGRRALSSLSGVSIGTMKHGIMNLDQSSAVVRARQEMHGLPMTIEDGGGLNSSMINIKARNARRRHGLGMIVVDHLHIIMPDAADARQGPTHAIGQISASMKRLAKEMECPVLLLAQLNRAVESRDDKRPGLGDLRQSGGIEQDADAVMFIYRPEYYLKTEPERRDGETAEKFRARVRDFHDNVGKQAGRAELILAKVRDGETGIIHLNFHGPTTSFQDAHTVPDQPMGV